MQPDVITQLEPSLLVNSLPRQTCTLSNYVYICPALSENFFLFLRRMELLQVIPSREFSAWVVATSGKLFPGRNVIFNNTHFGSFVFRETSDIKESCLRSQRPVYWTAQWLVKLDATEEVLVWVSVTINKMLSDWGEMWWRHARWLRETPPKSFAQITWFMVAVGLSCFSGSAPPLDMIHKSSCRYISGTWCTVLSARSSMDLRSMMSRFHTQDVCFIVSNFRA